MKKVAITILCLLGVTLTAMAQLADDTPLDDPVPLEGEPGIDYADVVEETTSDDLDPLFDDSRRGRRNRDRRGRNRRARSVLGSDEGELDEESLAERWKSAKSTSAKLQVVNALTKRLGGIFDEDMNRRKKHIDDIEKRLERLKELYGKRKDAKSKIVKFQAQAVTMEWEGLGFATSDRGQNAPVFRDQLSKPDGFDDALSEKRVANDNDSDLEDLQPVDTALPIPFDIPDDGSSPDDGDFFRDESAEPLNAPEIDDASPGILDAFGAEDEHPAFPQSEEASETPEAQFRKEHSRKVHSFVKRLSPDLGVREELADILLMVMHAGERKSSEVFHGSVLEAYHRAMQLQKRGEQIPGKFFATIAKMTEQKAKKVNPDDKADYVHLLARMHHASGNMEKAKSLSEHLVWHAPDNKEYLKFLKELQWETDPTDESSLGGSLPQLEAPSVPSLDSN